jgi:hypothetical protein
VRVLVKMRVTAANEEHTRVSMFTRVDGEGDVRDTPWAHNGLLVFDTAEWRDHLQVRFEAAGAEVETGQGVW